MLTDAQITDILFKKSLGLGTTDASREFYQEKEFPGRSFVVPSQIWSQANLIPSLAPTGSSGVVQKITGYQLTAVAGLTSAFTGTLFEDIIPFNWGDGTSYNYEVKDSTYAPIGFGVGDWTVDTEAGILLFNGTLPSNMPPNISFYKYTGLKGLLSGTEPFYSGYITTGQADLRYYSKNNESGFLNTLSGLSTGYVQDISGALSDRLNQTGADLFALINASSAGVYSVEGISGTIDLVGTGNIYISTGTSTIYISGDTGFLSSYATTANLASTGQQAWSAANNNSINLSGNLQTTGQNLYNLITGQSGYSSITYATIINLASTGQQSWDAANNNSVNLSGNLQTTGSNLYRIITGFSGQSNTDYATKANLENTGRNLYNIITGFSGSSDSKFALITNLASTGQQAYNLIIGLSGQLNTTGSNLDSKINSLSGFATGTFATITNLQSTGSYLYQLITGVSGMQSTANVENVVYTTGYQLISGFKEFANGVNIYESLSVDDIHAVSADSHIHLSEYRILTSENDPSIHWGNRELQTTDGDDNDRTTLNWQSGYLSHFQDPASGTIIYLDWKNRLLTGGPWKTSDRLTLNNVNYLISGDSVPTTIPSYMLGTQNTTVFGDSIIAGYVQPNTSFYEYLRTHLGWGTVNNYAVPGRVLSWSENQWIYKNPIVTGMNYILAHGFGETAYLPSDTQINECFSNALLNDLAWLAIPDNKKVIGSGTRLSPVTVLLTGQWAQYTVGTGRTGIYTSGNGNSITINNLLGENIICGFTVDDFSGNLGYSLNSGAYTIFVDDVLYGSYSGKNPASMNIVEGTSIYPNHPRATLISGLTNTYHNLRIVVDSATHDNNRVKFQWAAPINNSIVSSKGPNVYVGNVTRMSTGAQFARPTTTGGGTTYEYKVNRINNVIKNNANLLSNLNLNVQWIDSCSAIDNPSSTNYLWDGIHPTITGAQKIADTWYRFLTPYIQPFDRGRITSQVISSSSPGSTSGVSSLNSLTGQISLIGQGNISVSVDGQNINISGSDSIVYTTGNQTISGIKTFAVRPNVNGTGFLLSGDTIQTTVFVTGLTYISGISITGGDSITGQLNILAGNNVTLLQDGNSVTISSLTGGGGDITNAVMLSGNQTVYGEKTFKDYLKVDNSGWFPYIFNDRIDYILPQYLDSITGGYPDTALRFIPFTNYYKATGNIYAFSIYSYADIGGTKTYSIPITLTGRDRNDNNYTRIAGQWQTDLGAHGYKVVVSGDKRFGATGNYSFFTNNTSFDIGFGNVGVDSISNQPYVYESPMNTNTGYLTIEDISAASVSFVVDEEEGGYYSDGDDYSFRIYAYKNIGTGIIYSENGYDFSCNDGALDIYGRLDGSWDGVAGADGYKIEIVSDPKYVSTDDNYLLTSYTSFSLANNDVGQDTISNSSYQYQSPVVVTPSGYRLNNSNTGASGYNLWFPNHKVHVTTGASYEYHIYTYRDAVGGRIFSPTKVVLTGTAPNNNSTSGIRISGSWMSPTGSNFGGYKIIVKKDPTYGITGDYVFYTTRTYLNVTTGTSISLDLGSNTNYSLENPNVLTPNTGYPTYNKIIFNPTQTLINGGVGINEVSPSYTLDVVGDGRFTSNLNVGGTVTCSGPVYSSGVPLVNTGQLRWLPITGNRSNIYYAFGNVGIGTASSYLNPTKKLAVEGDVQISNSIYNESAQVINVNASQLVGQWSLSNTKSIGNLNTITGIRISGGSSITGGISISVAGSATITQIGTTGIIIGNPTLGVTGFGIIDYIPKYSNAGTGLILSSLIDSGHIIAFTGGNVYCKTGINFRTDNIINFVTQSPNLTGIIISGTSTTINNELNIGTFTFDYNPGIVTLVNLPIISGIEGVPYSGQEQSYAFSVQNNPCMTIYSESDGASASGVRNTTLKIQQGLSLTPNPMSSGSLELGAKPFYIYTGTTGTTWTLPPVNSCTGRIYFIKNRGYQLTLSGNDSTERLFDSYPILSLNVRSGDAFIVANDGNYWNIM